MAAHFGKLLARLRGERGLSQGGLANLAGMHLTTISKAEASPTCTLRRSNARVIYEALEKAGPIDAASAAAFFSATGLAASIAIARELMASPEGVVAQAIFTLKQSLPTDEERDAVQYLFELIDAAGAPTVVDALRGVAAALRVELTPAASQPPTRAVRVIHPPRQIAPSMIEQIEEEFTTRELPERVTPPKGKRKDGTA